MERKEVYINNRKIAYYQQGYGEVVLFLHGWGDGGQRGGFLCDVLKDKCIVAPDFPGFGGSGVISDSASVDDYADFVKNFCYSINIDKCIVVAHSFGARVVAKMFEKKINIFSKVILLGGAGIERKGVVVKTKSFLASIAKKVLSQSKTSQKLSDFLLKKFGSRDYLQSGDLRETFKKVIAEDQSKGFALINVPTLLLYGSNDMETPIWQARLINDLITGSKFVVVEGAAHYVFLDRPDRVGLEIKKFIYD